MSAVMLFWVYVPLVGAAVAWNWHAGLLTISLCLAAGLLFWTPLEYFLHRFAFHRLAPHFQHHDHPAERQYIFAPPWFSMGATVLLLPLMTLAAGSWQRGALVEAGTVCGYLFYELLHVRIHSQAAGGPLLRAWRRHHYYHHFADDTRCYGVVTPFWDRIFATLPQRRDSGAEFPYDVADTVPHGIADHHVRSAGEGAIRQ